MSLRCGPVKLSEFSATREVRGSLMSLRCGQVKLCESSGHKGNIRCLQVSSGDVWLALVKLSGLRCGQVKLGVIRYGQVRFGVIRCCLRVLRFSQVKLGRPR